MIKQSRIKGYNKSINLPDTHLGMEIIRPNENNWMDRVKNKEVMARIGERRMMLKITKEMKRSGWEAQEPLRQWPIVVLPLVVELPYG